MDVYMILYLFQWIQLNEDAEYSSLSKVELKKLFANKNVHNSN